MAKSLLAAGCVAITLSVMPVAAQASERLGDAALGALAGAVVLGPVGAVAGGVVGYVKGPEIADGMGLKKHRHRKHKKTKHHE